MRPTTFPARCAELLAELLDLIQAWLGDERFAGSRLTVLSPGSGAGPSDQLSAVLGSAVWGLVRSAAAEHPGRFALLDGEQPNWSQAAAAVAGGDWQLAVRDGRAAGASRLVCRRYRHRSRDVPELSDGTVLVTGGTSGLGALAAERLVRAHGVRRLLLLSRRGPATPGADELVDRLRGLGAEVTVLACDVANRRALAKALDSAAPAGRRGSCGRRARRRSGGPAVGRPAGAGAGRQGGRRLAPARTDRASTNWPSSSSIPRSPAASAPPARATTRRPTPSWTGWPATAAARACRPPRSAGDSGSRPPG